MGFKSEVRRCGYELFWGILLDAITFFCFCELCFIFYFKQQGSCFGFVEFESLESMQNAIKVRFLWCNFFITSNSVFPFSTAYQHLVLIDFHPFELMIFSLSNVCGQCWCLLLANFLILYVGILIGQIKLLHHFIFVNLLDKSS